MFVIKKTYSQFLQDFLTKHFNDFLNGRVGLYISPYFDNGKKLYQLTFDCDKKKVGNAYSKLFSDVKKIAKLFKNNIHIVTTNNGFHIITVNAIIVRERNVVDLNHMLRDKMGKLFPSIDWQGSIRIVPFGRLGLHPSGAYMNPISIKQISNFDKIKNKKPIEYKPDRHWWQEYVSTFLKPRGIFDLDEITNKLPKH